MYNSTEKLTLRVDLTDQARTEFEILKKHLGLTQNTEVIRRIIRSAYLCIPTEITNELIEEVLPLE